MIVTETEVAMNRIIIRIGIALLVIALTSLMLISLISMIEGVGGFPLAYSRSGRPSLFLGVAYLPIFSTMLIVGVIFLGRWIRTFLCRRGGRAGMHKRSSED